MTAAVEKVHPPPLTIIIHCRESFGNWKQQTTVWKQREETGNADQTPAAGWKDVTRWACKPLYRASGTQSCQRESDPPARPKNTVLKGSGTDLFSVRSWTSSSSFPLLLGPHNLGAVEAATGVLTFEVLEAVTTRIIVHFPRRLLPLSDNSHGNKPLTNHGNGIRVFYRSLALPRFNVFFWNQNLSLKQTN